VSTSIDDFGTGFSSLAYLRDLPVTELKVDRGFVQDVVSDSRSRLIVESVIRMAHALGMLTVAEGVEDGATHELLRQLGVDRVQGYLYARPMPSTAFDVWLTTHERRARTPVPADRPPVRT
jgi:EAL domain-containing protein (putative c-di-GMP-specific phosphodiesterase class I)